jgi:hypothetical protein
MWSCKGKYRAPARREPPGGWTKGLNPVATINVPLSRDTAQIAARPDLPEFKQLISDLGETQWTDAPATRSAPWSALRWSSPLYAIPTWTRTVALVKDHAGLRDVLGAAPSADAAYRFTIKFREHGDMLARRIAKVLARLHHVNPEIGNAVADLLGPADLVQSAVPHGRAAFPAAY